MVWQIVTLFYDPGGPKIISYLVQKVKRQFQQFLLFFIFPKSLTNQKKCDIIKVRGSSDPENFSILSSKSQVLISTFFKFFAQS